MMPMTRARDDWNRSSVCSVISSCGRPTHGGGVILPVHDLEPESAEPRLVPVEPNAA